MTVRHQYRLAHYSSQVLHTFRDELWVHCGKEIPNKGFGDEEVFQGSSGATIASSVHVIMDLTSLPALRYWVGAAE